MSKRTIFLLLLTIAIAGIFIVWFVHSKSDEILIPNISQVTEAKEKIRNDQAPEGDENQNSLTKDEAKLFKQLLAKVMEYNRKHPLEYSSSVNYQCKVVDQHGNAVPEAKYWVNYNKGSDNTQINHGGFNMKTDQNGLFQFTINDRVSTATVAVSKLGYKHIEGKSLRYLIQQPTASSSLANTEALTREEMQAFTELLPKSGLVSKDENNAHENPKVFVLHKMSDYDKMYQNMFTYSVNARDLDERLPGKYMMEYRNHNFDGIVPADAHVIQVGPCFYDKSKEKQLQIRYNKFGQVVTTLAAPWFSEMSIPGGGFYQIDEKEEPDGELYQSRYAAEAKEGEEFLAPESGYVETVRAEMPESRMDESWRGGFTKNYYVKFPDNTYGRIEVRMGCGGYNIISWYNSTGRRNTEFCLDDDLDVKYIEKKR
jgi:hypothetical protein